MDNLSHYDMMSSKDFKNSTKYIIFILKSISIEISSDNIYTLEDKLVVISDIVLIIVSCRTFSFPSLNDNIKFLKVSIERALNLSKVGTLVAINNPDN